MSSKTIQPPGQQDTLLLIDLQNDFLPGGALGVAGADALITAINHYSRQEEFGTVIATRDWHPRNHCSFKDQGGPWPAHCVAGSKGAEFPSNLDQSRFHYILNKGTSAGSECYSGFCDAVGQTTGLAGLLKARRTERVFICGLVLDYCVKETALGSLEAGFETILIPSLSPAFGPSEGILAELEAKGAKLLLL